MRFFFFLPAPAGPLTGATSWGLGAVEGAFGVGALWEEDGVDTGWVGGSGGAEAEGMTLLSWGWERDAVMLECIAVIFMARIMSELFWCFLGPWSFFSGESAVESSTLSASMVVFLGAESGEDGSIIGHTKPERGV